MHTCSTETKKDIYLPVPARIAEARMLNKTERYLRLEIEGGQWDYVPGQFVEISVAGIGEAPLTIASSPSSGDGLEIIVRKVGNVTNAIHRLEVGQRLGVRGPLGRGVYPIEEAKGRDILFICGGIGLVPQRSFIKYVLDHRSQYGKVVILQGVRDLDQRLLEDELAAWSTISDVTVIESLDRPDPRWQGHVGVVTTLIPRAPIQINKAIISVCGPPVMYKFVLMALQEYNVPHDQIYLNLERKMKCGVGKCGHCQINHLYCCVDGPVFKYSQIAGVPEAI
ncbi:MAG: FAD/NAD(P)-binding protein [Sedimentisphaerales bacterium]|jgi:NAD(P)H-flavin reductase|nr:FAD/NAD(P)-binding protein [Sedimentisphaerales bacterium]